MEAVIRLAKKLNKKSSHFNRAQFLEAFNELSIEDQVKAVEPGAELCSILVGWSCATRLELAEELA